MIIKGGSAALGVLCVLITEVVISPASAQQVIVYPARGQTAQQTEADKTECQGWARQQTGFDPATPPPVQGQPAPQGGVARGAARGAVVGGVVGAIGDDAGKGAAVGASSGALIGGFRQRDARQQQQSMHRQQVDSYNQQRSEFTRGYSACLEGRGYTIR